MMDGCFTHHEATLLETEINENKPPTIRNTVTEHW